MTQRAQGFWAGVLAGVAGAAAVLALPGGTLASGQAASPAAKYSSKIVLENDRVRVKDVTFPPGVLDTGMHTHDLAHVGVILTEGALRFTEPDGKSERVDFKAGSVGFRDANATHQVANPGTAPMRVIEVELK
jgi:quercetin dioxygenase-like cupin family protein